MHASKKKVAPKQEGVQREKYKEEIKEQICRVQ
jgi:hypothetical protein